jgi:hypothetical protein
VGSGRTDAGRIRLQDRTREDRSLTMRARSAPAD